MAARLVEAEAALASFAYAPITSRLARLLVRLAEKDSDRVVHASHDHLAALVGTYRETITTALHHLQRFEVIELSRRSIQILDMSGLEELASTWPSRYSG